MSKKMTIAEQFATIISKTKGVLTDSEIAFLRDRAEKAATKNANRKPTKAQVENDNLKTAILDVMEDNMVYTVSDLMKRFGDETISNQKMSALLRQLRMENLVTRNEVKGKAYFQKVVC